MNDLIRRASMNELIKLNSTSMDNELVQTVNARELYVFLEVQTRLFNMD